MHFCWQGDHNHFEMAMEYYDLHQKSFKITELKIMRSRATYSKPTGFSQAYITDHRRLRRNKHRKPRKAYRHNIFKVN